MILINTSKGEFFYERPDFEYATKRIDQEIAKENLFLFKDILDQSNVKFILAYGTLLGAIREGNFIEHDFDTDFIILEEHRSSFIDLLFQFRDHGFIVGRYENDILSLIRKGEYIDVYFFRKYLFFFRKIDRFCTYNRFLENTTSFNFLGGSFCIPEDYEAYLEHYYGKNWQTPVVAQHGEDFIFEHKMLFLFKEHLPRLYRVLKYIKNRLKSFVLK
jgi:lipopolysaccharide cholinephosphotransferase